MRELQLEPMKVVPLAPTCPQISETSARILSLMGLREEDRQGEVKQ